MLVCVCVRVRVRVCVCVCVCVFLLARVNQKTKTTKAWPFRCYHLFVLSSACENNYSNYVTERTLSASDNCIKVSPSKKQQLFKSQVTMRTHLGNRERTNSQYTQLKRQILTL